MTRAAAAPKRRVTPVMRDALVRLANVGTLRGWAHSSTYYALKRQGLVEDPDTITAAGRAAVADRL
jgi:hypothetical protein